MPKEVAARIEKEQLASIKYPADGKLLGDWKAGEKIAQSGRGGQYNDNPTAPSGANCYACHQITKQEVSYGTIGPSLFNFAKVRGFGHDIQKYAGTQVYNSHAYAACSSMPRFGHRGILTEQQIKDVVALLMDPNSRETNRGGWSSTPRGGREPPLLHRGASVMTKAIAKAAIALALLSGNRHRRGLRTFT